MTKKTTALQILVLPKHREKLKRMALDRGISMGAIVRQMIDSRYAHEYDNNPVCANGARCYVPQMHTDATQHPAPTPTANAGDVAT